MPLTDAAGHGTLRHCHAAPERRPGPRPPPRPEAEGVLRVSPGPASGSAQPLRRAARPGRPSVLLLGIKGRPHALPQHHRSLVRAGPAGRRPGRRGRGQRLGAATRGRAPATTRDRCACRAGLVGAAAGLPGGRGVAARVAGRAVHPRPRPRRRRHGRHGGRGRGQRGVPGRDHLDHLPPDNLASRGHDRVPARPRPPARGGRRRAGRGRPRLELARRVRRSCRRPAWTGWSWRSGWPEPWSRRWRRRVRRSWPGSWP